MSDRLPYEEQLAQQWNDLPLPDENMAWEDMKRRLDKDDDDGIIPVWLRGCGLWGLLAILLIGIGWWLIRPDKWWVKKQETANTESTNEKRNKSGDSSTITLTNNDTTTKAKDTGIKETELNHKKSSTRLPVDNPLSTENSKTKKSLQKKQTNPSTASIKSTTKKENKRAAQERGKKEKIVIANRQPKRQTANDKADISIVPAGIAKDPGAPDLTTNPMVSVDSVLTAVPPAIKTDSVVKKVSVDSATKKIIDSTAKTSPAKKDSAKPKTIVFSAGLGMHQLIPVAGQELTPYNAAGRKGSIADYIPSVFGRMYKNEKWFLQLEFRYGAPQYTKQFSYAQASSIDTIGQTQFTTTASYQLRKTFYHQLPLTFNYFVVKDWSIGAGIVWNKFFSAVSEQVVDRRNNTTQADSVLGKQILSTKDDTAAAFARSFFSKSYFQAVLETQYRWKRFSIGAKYSFGLQPYIQFTLPGGQPQKERNRSLQIFLRYELWKSKPLKLNP